MARIADKITPEVLARAAELYNSYSFEELDSDGPPQALVNVILKHNVQRFVRICHLHNHGKLPAGYARVGTAVEEPASYLTKPTRIDAIDCATVRGQVYSVTRDANRGVILYPSEFRAGTQDGVQNLRPDFLEEFITCLMKDNMEKTFGLGLAEDREMIEHTTSGHSLMFGKGVVHEKYHLSPATSWIISAKDGEVHVAGEMQCIPTPDFKHVWVKPTQTAVAEAVTEAVTVSPAVIIAELRQEGVLKA